MGSPVAVDGVRSPQPTVKKIAAGVVKFQREIFPERKAFFAELGKGQAPKALLVACSDSRIDPGLVTQTDPGELFVCRNAGNIVPPHSNHSGAMTSAVASLASVPSSKNAWTTKSMPSTSIWASRLCAIAEFRRARPRRMAIVRFLVNCISTSPV